MPDSKVSQAQQYLAVLRVSIRMEAISAQAVESFPILGEATASSEPGESAPICGGGLPEVYDPIAMDAGRWYNGALNASMGAKYCIPNMPSGTCIQYSSMIKYPPPQNDNQQEGRPDYCAGGMYIFGKFASDIAPVVADAGVVATFLGAPEVGGPLLGAAGALSIGGSLLKDNAAGKTVGFGTGLNIGETLLINRIPVADSVRTAAPIINEGLGRVQDKILDNTMPGDPCE